MTAMAHTVSDANPLSLLLVADDDVLRQSVRAAIEKSGMRLRRLEDANAQSGLVRAITEPWDCLLISERASQGIARDLLNTLLVRPLSERAPVVLIADSAATQRPLPNVQSCLDGNRVGPLAIMQAVTEAVSLRAQLDAQKASGPRQASRYDEATDLPNRTMLIERLEQALRLGERTRQSFALLMIDADTSGTASASLDADALREIASKIGSAVRRSDTVARLGGSEFVVLLTVGNEDGAVRVAGKILEAFTPVADAVPSAAVGIALYPAHGRSREELLRAADSALYLARRNRRGLLVATKPDESWQGARRDLAQRIGAAVEQDEFVLRYQPIVDLASNEVCGVEALVRWLHPELGLLPPAEFLHLAERDSAINALSLKVLERALQQVRAWRDLGVTLPVSVNLSPHALELAEFQDFVLKMLHDLALPEECLTLELRDENLAQLSPEATRTLFSLNGRGVRFAIDDFGKGVGSLNLLRDLPASEIKLDPVMLSNARDEHTDEYIASAVIALGKSLGKRVTAKGVENRETLLKLRALGCERAQGFCFSAPMDAEALTAWRERWIASQQ